MLDLSITQDVTKFLYYSSVSLPNILYVCHHLPSPPPLHSISSVQLSTVLCHEDYLYFSIAVKLAHLRKGMWMCDAGELICQYDGG